MAVIFGLSGYAYASYGLYVGKNLTEDGSVMLGGTGDEVSGHWIEIIPRQTHGPDATVGVGVTDEARYPGEMMDIPQARTTYRFLSHTYSNFAGFPPPLTNGGLNEYGVAARDIWSPSRSELRGMTDDPQRGLNYSDLSRAAMQQARSAEGAVDVVGRPIDRYGFATYGGNSHLFADAEEGWVFINYAGSQGLWVAERLGPDEIRMSYPGYLTPIPARHIDFQSLRLKANSEYKASSNFIRFAVEQGWYDPSTRDDFDANTIYGNVGRDKKIWSTDVSGGETVIHPLTGEDVANWTIADFEALMEAMAPISLEEMMELVRSPLISDDSNGYGQVAHLRNDLAHADLGVLWMSATGAVTSPFVPFYIGTQEVPIEYAKHRYLYRDSDATFVTEDWAIQEATDFAYRTFKQLMYFTLDRPDVFLPEVNEALVGFEAAAIDEQEKVIEIATVLIENGHLSRAREYLTDYTSRVAGDALEMGEGLLAGIQARTRAVYGLRRPEGETMQGGSYSAVTGVIIQSFENPELDEAAHALRARTTAPAIEAMSRTYEAGEEIEIVFANAQGHATDWIGLAEVGAANDSFVDWQYIEGQEVGYAVFPEGLAEPGQYEARLFWEDGYTLGASFRFTVE